MEFKEALEKLKEGKKIRRKEWEETLHIKIDPVDDKIKGFRQERVPLIYDMDILTSTEWTVIDDNEVVDFATAAIRLKQRKKVRFKDWQEDTYLEWVNDYNFCMMQIMPYAFLPSFYDVTQTDWELC